MTGSFRRVPYLIVLSVIGWVIEGSTLYLTAAAVNVPLSVAGAIMAALASSLLSTIPLLSGGAWVYGVGHGAAADQLWDGDDPGGGGGAAE